MSNPARLDTGLVDIITSTWPSPIADALWRAEGAENPHEYLLATLNVFFTVQRFLAALALSVRIERGAGPGGDPARVRALLQTLSSSHLTGGGWHELARELLRPWRHDPIAHPFPELVRLYHDSRSTAVDDLDALVALRNETAHPFKAELAQVLALTGRTVPAMQRVLTALMPLIEPVRLVVPTGKSRSARWLKGITAYNGQSRRLDLAEAGQALPSGQAVLVDAAGRLLVTLDPVVRVRAVTTDSVVLAVFFLEGGKKDAGTYLSLPSGDEYSEPAVWPRLHERLTVSNVAAESQSGAILHRPYRGLQAFHRADAELFFGREELVDQLTHCIRETAFVTVLGPSGSGKTSLLEAGVGPALERRGLAVREAYRTAGPLTSMVLCRPSQDPWGALLAALRRALDGFDDGGAPETPVALAGAVAAWAQARDRGVVVVVDQGEELFTMGASPEASARFAEALAALAVDAKGSLRVVYVVREDFFGRLGDLAALAPLHMRSMVNVRTPDDESLTAALVAPARRFGARFDEGLVERMVAEAKTGPATLPVLQFTADLLWEDCKENRVLTAEAYKALGGVVGALTRYADKTVGAESGPRATAAREVMLALVSSEGTRVTMPRAELLARVSDRAVAESVIDALVEARLLTSAVDARGAATIELAHEALLTQWKTLQGWRVEDVEGHAQRARVSEATRAWVRSGRREDLLSQGTVLAEIVAWRSRTTPRLTTDEAAFVAGSQAKERRRWRRGVGAIAIVVASLATFAAVAGVQWRKARREREVGKYQLLLARARELSANHAPTEAAVMMVAAAQQERKLDLRGVTAHADVIERDDHPIARVLRGHTAGITAMEFSPDGTRLVTASEDHTARIWDAHTGQLLHSLEGHRDKIVAIAFSSDGTRLATASHDFTARIWDANAGRLLRSLTGFDRVVYDVTFSPDGSRLATASFDYGVRIWETETGQAINSLTHHDLVRGMKFSPDGTRIATGCSDSNARIWDVTTGHLLHLLEGHTDHIQAIAFSPSGALLATTSTDNSMRIWDVSTGHSLRVLMTEMNGADAIVFSPDGRLLATQHGFHAARIWAVDGSALCDLRHDGSVRAIAFSPDGERLATGDDESLVKIWDTSGRLLDILHGHTGPITAVAFSRDGGRIATASEDRTGRIWEAGPQHMLRTFQGHSQSVTAVAFSPNGRWIGTGSEDHTARIWDAATGRPLHSLEGHTWRISSMAFSSDGTRVLTGSWDSTVRVWETGTGRLVHVLEGDGSAITAMALSPDGSRLIVCFSGRDAQIWETDTWRLLRSVQGLQSWVYAIGFSPDGKQVIAGSAAQTAEVWDAATGRPRYSLHGHTDSITAATFSPDGTRLVTGSRDSTVRIWEAGSGRHLQALRGHNGGIAAIAFSPDGTRLVSGSDDLTARVWEVGTWRLLHAFRGHALQVTSVAFSPDGRLLVTGANDHLARLWQTEAPAAAVAPAITDVLRRTNFRICRDSLDVIPLDLPSLSLTDAWAPATACRAVSIDSP